MRLKFKYYIQKVKVALIKIKNFIIIMIILLFISLLIRENNSLHIPQNLRIRSEGTERHSALN